MELLCCESESVTRAYEDPVLLEDSRVFENLLVLEDRYVLNSCYFKCFQTDIKPNMRTIIAEWMQEVSEEEHCQDEVFPLAVNCLDRFLSLVRVDKHHLQLLGSVCLFLASKLRQSRPLTAERLCLYADHSFTVTELLLLDFCINLDDMEIIISNKGKEKLLLAKYAYLVHTTGKQSIRWRCTKQKLEKNWELLVLNTLKWDLAAVTPFDFVGHILRRLPIKRGVELVKRHTHTFIDLCTADVKFTMYPPSMIAASSIAAAMHGLAARLDKQWQSCTPNELLLRLHDITGIDADCLRACWEQIEETLVKRLANAARPITASVTLPVGIATNHKLAEQQLDPNDPLLQAETPTDVQDILF